MDCNRLGNVSSSSPPTAASDTPPPRLPHAPPPTSDHDIAPRPRVPGPATLPPPGAGRWCRLRRSASPQTGAALAAAETLSSACFAIATLFFPPGLDAHFTYSSCLLAVCSTLYHAALHVYPRELERFHFAFWRLDTFAIVNCTVCVRASSAAHVHVQRASWQCLMPRLRALGRFLEWRSH